MKIYSFDARGRTNQQTLMDKINAADIENIIAQER